MEPITVYVIMWHFEENVRPMESEHFYDYYDAERKANQMIVDGEVNGVRYYRIEKRRVLR